MTRSTRLGAAVAATLVLVTTAALAHGPTPSKTAFVEAFATGPIARPAESKAVATKDRKAASKRDTRKFEPLVARYADTYDVPLQLAHAIIRIESNYRPDALGASGEIGLMQIKPATARLMGYRGTTEGLFDPATNIKYGMKYLGKARELGDKSTCGTVLKYNAGHGAKRMNPISAAYCAKVMQQMRDS